MTKTALVLLAATTLNAALIDFDALPIGTVGTYSEQGVTFSRTGSALRVDNAPNGTHGMTIATPGPVNSNVFLAQFTTPMAFVAVDLGDFGGDSEVLFLRARNAANLSLDLATAILGTASGMRRLTVSAPSAIITSVEMQGIPGNNTIFFDNFEFSDQPPATVPEPRLGLAALLALGALRLIRTR